MQVSGSEEQASPASYPSNSHLGIDVCGVDKRESVGSCEDSSMGANLWREEAPSPRKVVRQSWGEEKQIVVERVRGGGVGEMALTVAVVYTGIAVVVSTGVGVSFAGGDDEGRQWMIALSVVLGVFSGFFWTMSLSGRKFLSRRGFSVTTTASLFTVSILSHLAYPSTPSTTGLLQSLLLSTLLLNDTRRDGLCFTASIAASWIFSWIYHSHSLSTAFTPSFFMAVHCAVTVTHPYLRLPTKTVKITEDLQKLNADSPGSVSPDADSPSSLYRINARNHERLHSELSSSNTGGRAQKKPSISSSDMGAFFVAPLETINTKLSAVCRASVDGSLVFNRGDDESSTTTTEHHSTTSGFPRGRPPLRPSSSVMKLPSDSKDATQDQGSPMISKQSRSFSLSSHQSLMSESSAATSYVSFNPTLKRGGDGHTTSFASPVLRQEEEDPQEDLDDAESFANAVSRSSSEDIVTSELKQHMTPSATRKKASVAPNKSLHKRSYKGSMSRPGTAARGPPSTPPSPQPVPATTPSSGGLSFMPMGKLMTEDESKKDVAEAMDLVKSVVQLDFSATIPQNHPLAGGMKMPLQNLSSTTLQKLVVLFTRLSEELDTYRIQRFICACVVQVLQCERASIFLCDWNKQVTWTISDDGHEIRVPMMRSLAGYAALNNRVLNIKDAYKDARFNKEVDKNTGYVTKNMLVYPISRGVNRYSAAGGSNIIAVVEAINKSGGGVFTAEDEGVLALLGKQAGIHLSNAQIYQQLQVEGNKTNSLLEVSKEINDVQLDIGAMMSKIMSRARQVLTVERASIFLVDDTKKELWSILTDSETAAQIGGDNVIRLPVGVGLAGHVAVTGNVLNIPDAYACDLFNPEFDRKTGFVTKATLCVPVKPQHSNKVMGVIQFINKCNGDSFHDSDVELALSFSSFVGISLNNILLYDELREGQVLREKNRELVRLRDQAKQAAEAKSNFLMAMSHEIRTPMAGVIGMCELLMNTTLSGEQKEMADTIKSCGEALMAIINDILDYGRLDAGKLELEKRPFELVTILEETIDVVRPKTEAKAITLMLDVDPSLTTELIGDVYRLRQVLTNLLGNAVKFTPDGGDITLQVNLAELTQKFVSLNFAVTDTGIGIANSAQKKLFRPFEQADAGTTRQYGGSGLGLAICKQLVEAMEGEIGIESVLGEGSTFWFTAVFGRGGGKGVTVLQFLNQIAGNNLDDAKSGKVAVFGCTHAKTRNVLSKLFTFLKMHTFFVDNYPELLSVLRGDRSPPTTFNFKPGTVQPAGDLVHPSKIDLVILDEGLDGMGVGEVTGVAKICSENQWKFVNLMTMKHKTAITDKNGYGVILTKPPKLSLVAGVLNPQSDSGASGVDQRQEEAIPSGQGVGKILVAEDNATNQLLIKKQLAGYGISPKIVSNGQEAVDALRAETFTLIFMDCHMPVLDGYGATKKIRELEKSQCLGPSDRPVYIVALTADALPHTKGLCVAAGMDDYITKPLRRATLKEVLDKYCYAPEAEETS